VNESLINKLRPAPILVAGDVMVDEYILGDVERISPESPVPVLVTRDRFRRLGGAGNVVRNLITMGGKVALVATVGRDTAGDWFKRHCEEMSVEAFWIKDDPNRPTTLKTRVVARNQQIVRIDEEHVADISPEIEAAAIHDIATVMPQVQAVIISDYGKGFLTPRLLKALLIEATSHAIPVLVDPKGMDYTKYRGATYITPNLREASTAAGIEIRNRESLVEAGQILLDQSGAQGIIITRGKDGSTLITKKKTQDFPVRTVEIVDVTGAGDTVIAALALAIASDFTVEDAISLANLAASLVVARFGAAAVTVEEMARSLRGDHDRNKVIGLNDIASVIKNHRLRGHKVVFTNGCFDLFHAGHLEILRQASSLGNVLVVGINSDKSVARIKGPGRPIVGQNHRTELVCGLDFVDYVVVFDEDTPLNLIGEVRPDILVKGEDWKGKKVVGEEIVRSRGGSVEFVRLLPGVSTSELIRKIKGEV